MLNAKKRTDNYDMKGRICSTCVRAHSNLFTAENGMDIGEMPNCLKGTRLVERILIARVHPVVSVFKIRGAQRAYSGHVMNFVHDVSGIAMDLPDKDHLSTIIILNR